MARLLQKASSSRFRGYMFPQLQESRWGFLETTTQLCNFSTKGTKKSKSDASDSGEENLSKKESALNVAMDQITKSFGKGSIMWLGRSVSQRQTPVVSTGSFALDVALGIGGLPKGRIVEIYGPEASGKTTIALHVVAEAQKLGGCCAYVDAEYTLVPSLAEAIGVNTENLLIARPDCGEKALSLVDTLIRSGSVDVVVVDSVAALVPKGELDGEMGDATQARLMSQALRKLTLSLSLSQTVLLFTNQVQSKPFTFRGFGGPSEVGKALKFYASIRINIKRTALIKKKGEETTGSQVTVKVMKNKHAPPYKTAVFELEFGKGICRESELLDLGCKYNFISKSGAYFKMNDRKCQGKEAFKRYLAENVSDRQQLQKKLRDKLFNDEGSTAQITDEEEEEAVAAAEA